VVLAFFNQAFNIDNIHTSRHVANSLFGWLCIVFVGLIAYRIAGWRAGVIAMLMLFLSPRFLGHSFNNCKDIPFAAAVVMAVFFMLQFFRQFPNVKKVTLVLLTLSIALSISIRIGGLILFGFFGIFGLLFLVQEELKYRAALPKAKKGAATAKSVALYSTAKRLLTYGVGICVAGYFLGLLLWPYALQAPIKHPLEAFSVMSKFAVSLRQNFEGVMQWSSELPWYYTPKYILITVPLAIFVGLLSYLFVGGLKKENRFSTIVVYFAFIFPVFWLVYSNANVYGGWRHSLFVYPFMVVAAGLGFNALIDAAKQKYAKFALTLLPLALLLSPAIFTVKNHPYEYVFFNRLAGGIKGAYGNYEMDYYYHSTREASEWVLDDVRKNGAPDSTRKTKVVSWHSSSVNYFLRKDTADISVGFVRWNERGFNDWDYAIFTITGMNAELLKNKKAFPPKNTAYQIKVDGVPICIVLKREENSDFYGHKAMQQRDFNSAVPLLKKALAYDNYNEQALNDLILIYQQANMLDSAQVLAQQWVAFNKGSTPAMTQLANTYLAKGDFSKAIVTASQIIKYNNRDVSGLWVTAQAQAQQGQPNDALRTLQRLLKMRGDFKPAYQLMAQIYDQAGDKQRAQQILNAMPK
jgi:Flp pilus assembly protein TadD